MKEISQTMLMLLSLCDAISPDCLTYIVPFPSSIPQIYNSNTIAESLKYRKEESCTIYYLSKLITIEMPMEMVVGGILTKGGMREEQVAMLSAL